MGKVALACVLMFASLLAEISSYPLTHGALSHYAGCNHLYYPGLKCLTGTYYNYNYCGCRDAVVSNIKIVSGKGLCISRADPFNEGVYVLLDNGIPTKMRCAEGTIYSTEICGCTHPPKAPQPEAPVPVSKPEEPAKCLSSADPNSASCFFVNVHGVDTQMFCAPGTAYSQVKCGCTIHAALPGTSVVSKEVIAASAVAKADYAPVEDDKEATAVASAVAYAAASAQVDPALAAAVAATGPMCHNLPDPSDQRAYFVFEHGKRKKMICGPGSLYSPVTCACGVNLISATGPRLRVARPVHHYPCSWRNYPGYYPGRHAFNDCV